MALEKIDKIRNKKIKANLYVVFILLILFLMALFSAANLITIIELRKQVNLVINDVSDNQVIKKDDSLLVTTTPPVIPTPPDDFIYSNMTTDQFFGSTFIDGSKTDMRLDDQVNALTYLPVYNFNYEKDCNDSFCGFLKQENLSCLDKGCLTKKDGEIYFKNNKIELPGELKDKKIINFTFNPLSTKWVIGVVFGEGGEEVGYAYLFDGNKLTPLITDKTAQKIKTRYGHLGGSISAGGSDKQFIILYSGYEGIGYLYNNGFWQDLSQYFSLRTVKGGFKSKIIKGGAGKSAVWFICSNEIDKPRLIKLWQNGTDNIQGVINLSNILEDEPAICAPKGSREINIARTISGQDVLYTFGDRGFNNSKPYHYQSVNLSDYKGKIILTVRLSSYVINAKPNSYSLAVSPDGINWKSNNDKDIDLKEANSDSFYIKGDFKTSDSEYSPWFGGIKLISYTAQNRK